jgi:hypothetical protein
MHCHAPFAVQWQPAQRSIQGHDVSMQSKNVMADDPKAFKLAMEVIKASPAYEALKLKILAAVDQESWRVRKSHQIPLMKRGRSTDSGWQLLKKSIDPFVKLAAPFTFRSVCSTF